jgi:hypothetical protein
MFKYKPIFLNLKFTNSLVIWNYKKPGDILFKGYERNEIKTFNPNELIKVFESDEDLYNILLLK